MQIDGHFLPWGLRFLHFRRTRIFFLIWGGDFFSSRLFIKYTLKTMGVALGPCPPHWKKKKYCLAFRRDWWHYAFLVHCFFWVDSRLLVTNYITCTEYIFVYSVYHIYRIYSSYSILSLIDKETSFILGKLFSS